MDRGITKKSVSILGCGWLGFPLARRLIAEGFEVKGSTTSTTKIEKLEAAGIIAFPIQLNPTNIEGEIEQFLQSDILILNIPPGRRNPNVEIELPQKIALLLKLIVKSPIQKLIFVSSTSVYGNEKGTVTEAISPTPSTSSGKALLAAEKQLETLSIALNILRPGGLVGPHRHPGRFLAGRKGLKNGDAPINLIHLEDVIGIIINMISQNKWGSIFNASAGVHPKRRDYYIFAAEKLNMEKPEFLPGGESEKLISNEHLKKVLGYQFIYDNPFEMMGEFLKDRFTNVMF